MGNAVRALWCEAAGRAAIRTEGLPAPVEGDALVRAEVSAISRGTERLVFEGRVPESEFARMRAPFQAGEFSFPVKYGYAMVGTVEEGPPDLVGRRVFALHPHQSRFRAPADALVPLPPDLPPRRAALAANMETALNALWDAGSAPGDRSLVVGGGPVGLLVASLLSRMPGAEIELVDKMRGVAKIASQINVKFGDPARPLLDCDRAFNCSASAAGLQTALDALGPEGVAVEMSWMGTGETPLALGGAFHSRRLRIVSSQVGALAPERRPRWTLRRRLALALDLLAADPSLDALIGEAVPFEDAPARLPELLAPGAGGPTACLVYG